MNPYVGYLISVLGLSAAVALVVVSGVMTMVGTVLALEWIERQVGRILGGRRA